MNQCRLVGSLLKPSIRPKYVSFPKREVKKEEVVCPICQDKEKLIKEAMENNTNIVKMVHDYILKKNNLLATQIYRKTATGRLLRGEELAWCRHEIRYFAYLYCDLSLLEIATLTGARDHSTIIHSKKQVQDRIDVDSAYALKIQKIKNDLQKMQMEL